MTGRSGFSCSYSQSYKVAVGTKIVSSCTGCAKEVQTIYETRYRYTTRTASCPSGLTQSGNTCVATTTRTATCASGTLSNGVCVISGTSTITRNATCPSGYDLRNGVCAKDNVYTVNRDAACPADERRDGGKC